MILMLWMVDERGKKVEESRVEELISRESIRGLALSLRDRMRARHNN